MQAIQLSHEEFLLLLGVLRLPMPLALGEDPTVGYDQRSLGIALASAMSSLMARDLIQGDDPTTDPVPVPGVRELLATSALADRCLMVAARQGEQHSATHYSLRDGRTVVHTSPRAGVHRITWVEASEPLAAHVLTAIVPHVPTATPLRFTLNADAFGLALDAIGAGQLQSALGILKTAGVAADLADSFVSRAGPTPTRYAIVCLRQLQSPQPLAESAIVVQGANETWYATEPANTPGQILIETVAPEALRTHLDVLIQSLA